MTTFLIKIQSASEPPVLGTLGEAPRTIGRSPESDFVLQEDSVSRQHARLFLQGGRPHIEDLNSSNGVYVNDARVRRAAIAPGDRIRVGDYSIMLEPLSGPASPPACNRTEVVFDEVGPLHERMVDHDHTALSFLYRLTQRMGGQRCIRSLLQVMLDEVMEALPAERGFILAREDHDGALQTCVSKSRQRYDLAPPISRTLIDHVVATRSSVLTSDAGEDERFENAESIAVHQIKAAICVPLTSHDTVFGVIYADADSVPMPFTQTHLQLMSVVGQVGGAAVAHLQLIEKQIHQERLAAIGQTVSATSHDMRNILTGISGGTQLLETAREQKNWDRAAKATRIIQRSLERFENLVNSLLLFARKTELCLQAVDIGGLIREVIETLEPAAAKLQVAIRFKDGGIPRLSLDAQQMHRVLVNLVKNALDAMENSGGTLTIETSSEDGAHVVRIRDTGPGIATEHLPRMGQAFFTTKEGRGTGLGLAVCYRIVEQHRGKILVDSEPGKGSTFTLVFPAVARTTARIDRIPA